MRVPPNILLITADDMNWDAVGAFGCPTPETTPNIDRLASEGIRFENGHVTIAVCQPSRSAIMTGRYPHQSGGEGFHKLRFSDIPLLPERLRESGYTVGILGKVGHSTPYGAFNWNMMFDMPELGQGRNPEIYYTCARSFMETARETGRPFFLMANSHDPHRPFYGNDKEEWYEEGGENPPAAVPSKAFTAEEVTVPGFLPDLPEVRLEISEYYNSVRRCDDTVGRILDALRETGQEDNTLVLFLSDNGMAFPFAKTNCYLNSTRTPWIMRWPGRIKAGRVDFEHFVSGIDILPTFLDAAGIEIHEGVSGRSFLPLLEGNKQGGREYVFTTFNQTAARNNYPMRCVQSKKYGYIYNPWSDG
ncbi:MAG: sulfatase, partial [Candidatus Sumerlaeota bacterium]